MPLSMALVTMNEFLTSVVVPARDEDFIPQIASSYRGSGGFGRGAVLVTERRANGGRPSTGNICCYLPDLVTPTFKTPSLFDSFSLELHLS